MPRGIIALVFRCKITGGQLTTNNEVTAFRWADQAAIRQLTTEAYAIAIPRRAAPGRTPAIRQHDGTDLIDDASGRSRACATAIVIRQVMCDACLPADV